MNGIPTPQRRTQDESVILLSPDEAFYQSNLDKFNQYRRDIQQKLFNLVQNINIGTKNFQQGIYTEGDFSVGHQAILS